MHVEGSTALTITILVLFCVERCEIELQWEFDLDNTLELSVFIDICVLFVQ